METLSSAQLVPLLSGPRRTEKRSNQIALVLEVSRKQAPPLFLSLSFSLCVSSFRTQTCKCARLTQAASTCNVSLLICRNIYRSGDLVQTSAFSSLSKAHSDCKKAKGKMSKLQRFSRKKIHMQHPEHQSNPLAPSRSPHAAHWSAAG